MRAKLKELQSLDFSTNNYEPPDKECFVMLFTATIGAEEGLGGDNFDFQVCTPNWLKASITEPTWGNRMLIVNSFNFIQIKRVIESYCDACVGNNWEEIAAKISRIAHWEFDNYKPYKDQ